MEATRRVASVCPSTAMAFLPPLPPLVSERPFVVKETLDAFAPAFFLPRLDDRPHDPIVESLAQREQSRSMKSIPFIEPKPSNSKVVRPQFLQPAEFWQHVQQAERPTEA